MNYKEVKTLEFPNMAARIYIPELSQEERTKRMAAIRKAATELLKKAK